MRPSVVRMSARYGRGVRVGVEMRNLRKEYDCIRRFCENTPVFLLCASPTFYEEK